MNKNSVIAIAISAMFVIPLSTGCGDTATTNSASTEAKLKGGFENRTTDMSKLTPEQKKGMEAFAKGGGGAASKEAKPVTGK
ncbi:MAG: hypothetical protein H8F28_05515 [Fibrella sp.]|nr:hypothetical protein [Armatimonadota bacterium]